MTEPLTPQPLIKHAQYKETDMGGGVIHFVADLALAHNE